jgi:hypothetical protein
MISLRSVRLHASPPVRPRSRGIDPLDRNANKERSGRARNW